MAAKHNPWWLALVFVVGAAVLIAGSAWADDDGDEPPRVKKKVKIRGAENAEEKPARNPMDTVQRWMMKEMSRHMAAMADAKGDAGKSPLHYWFETKDVPLAGLRDALKADGWTADELMQWMHQHLMHALMQAGSGMFDLGGMLPGGPQNRFRSRGRMRRGRGFRGSGFGPGTTRGRSIIIWNDGNGWRTRFGGVGPDMPSPSPWGGFRRFGPDSSPHGGGQGIEQLIEMLRRLQGQGRTGEAPPPAPQPPRPPAPPGGMRGGMRAPAGPEGMDILRRLFGPDGPSRGAGGAGDAEQLHEMLRRLQQMLKDLPVGRGETDMSGEQMEQLMKQIMRMLQPAEAAPAKKKNAKAGAPKKEKKLKPVRHGPGSRDW